MVFLLMTGCSYYGTNTFLAPLNKGKAVSCPNVDLDIGRILIRQEKKSYAFSGIPYFPSIGSSDPAQIGELDIWYRNIDNTEVCTTEDLLLQDGHGSLIYKPQTVWKSKLVEKDGIKYQGCIYKFGRIDEHQQYLLKFKEGFLGCQITMVQLTIEKDDGYHQVLMQ